MSKQITLEEAIAIANNDPDNYPVARLNESGRKSIQTHLEAWAKPGYVIEAYYSEAENDVSVLCAGHIEVGRFHSLNGNPHPLWLDMSDYDWFENYD